MEYKQKRNEVREIGEQVSGLVVAFDIEETLISREGQQVTGVRPLATDLVDVIRDKNKLLLWSDIPQQRVNNLKAMPELELLFRGAKGQTPVINREIWSNVYYAYSAVLEGAEMDERDVVLGKEIVDQIQTGAFEAALIEIRFKYLSVFQDWAPHRNGLKVPFMLGVDRLVDDVEKFDRNSQRYGYGGILKIGSFYKSKGSSQEYWKDEEMLRVAKELRVLSESKRG